MADDKSREKKHRHIRHKLLHVPSVNQKSSKTVNNNGNIVYF